MPNQEIEIAHPKDRRLIFSAIFHEAEPATGEYKYSLGDPPVPKRCEITAVAWQETPSSNPVDVTEFILNYCDQLLPEWEEKLLES